MNNLAEIAAMLNRDGTRHERYAARRASAAVARELWARWCALNGVTMRRQAFALSHLAEAKYPSWRNQSWRLETWPGNDHSRWFWANHRPAMIVSEPYGARHLRALSAHVRAMGLELHTPPNPFASFHYPGRTVFAAITRAGREVRWLEEQVQEMASTPWSDAGCGLALRVGEGFDP